MNKKFYFCGFNGFRQFGGTHAPKINAPEEFSSEYLENKESLYSFSWAFNVFASNENLTVKGFVDQKPNNERKYKMNSTIKKISSNDNNCLILLENGDLHNLNIRQGSIFKLNFIDVEKSNKRNIFGKIKDENVNSDVVENIACGNSICVAITKNNSVYNIPSKIYQFPAHEKIKSIECGFEHAIALNSNGDVYSWGNGLRGQLGHSDLKIHEIPLIVDALAGIKIIKIAAGGWHSAVLSAFNDIYVWGSNVNGQLGIKVFKDSSLDSNKISVSHLKNPTVYSLPQLIDLPNCCDDQNQNNENSAETRNCDVIKIVCGGRHTFIQKSCGKIFCSGWNEHGQLGIECDEHFKDNFIENESLSKITTAGNILCGPWCTVMIC